MKNKPDGHRRVIMEQARQLLDQGRCQEGLSLALDVLLDELNNLRHSLNQLEKQLQLRESRLAPRSREEEREALGCWLPEPKPRILH